ncbi:MAG: AAA family ATPase [Bacteriovoracaceae bacterium]|jgi:MoxR-like ATPase|nr:AAA family ATPase [Bacteriovoracaceae bacterium]
MLTKKLLDEIIINSESILKGKQEQVKLVLCNILAKGHTLIEDSPGVGKTTLVKYIGKSLGLDVSRIQFTNDLLPADILGSSIFNKETHQFEFHKGPLFGELILADELNRAPPKTQSALLQAMEERTISLENETYHLPEHFTVIATQNPHMQVGTFSLPESQLDRFAMKIKMGYPDEKSTIQLLKEHKDLTVETLTEIISIEQMQKLQKEAQEVLVDDSIYQLIYEVLSVSRNHKQFVPLSNRCGIDLVQAAKSWALLEARDYVIPDDIYYILPYVIGHRLVHPENSDIHHENKMTYELINILDQHT